MATFRPAVNEDDGYVQKIIKYIPAEIVAGYTALVGYLSVDINTQIPSNYKTYYLILLVTLIIITPIWTFFGVIDNKPDETNKRRAYFHGGIAFFAFIIWVYALGNPILKAILCNCEGAAPCKECSAYSTVLGSIILVLFTILTPLIERIILGTRLP